MTRRLGYSSKSAGQAPGSLIYIGDTPINDVLIKIIEYNKEEYNEKEVKFIEECLACKNSGYISWINVDGVHNVEIIRILGEQYDLHTLLLEDVLNTEQRPKIEFYEQHIFVVVKMLEYNSQTNEVEAEQVSMFLGNNYVVSLQEEREGDVFNPVRARLKATGGKIRRSGADFLLYSLLDMIVDNYYLVLEKIGERLEDLEEEITTQPTEETLRAIYSLKRELIFMRKAVWPLREIISAIEREETPLIKKDIRKYVRDVYDHTIQVIDTTESYRETMASLLDVYLSSISNKTNDVMKVLTIISTIFMPLTFIVGVYGMNFEHMPELRTKYGYFVVWGIMTFITACMIYFFRRKKWL